MAGLKVSWVVSLSGRAEIIVFVLLVVFNVVSDCYPKVMSLHRAVERDSSMVNSESLDKEAKIRSNNNFLFKSTNIEKPGQGFETSADFDDLIPDFDKIIVIFEPDDSLSSTEILHSLHSALSRILHIPMENVRILEYNYVSGEAKFYFLNVLNNGKNDVSLIPASEIISSLSIGKLENETSLLKIIDVKAENALLQDVKPTSGQELWYVHVEKWGAWKFAVIVVCSLFALISVFIIIYLFSSCRVSKNSSQTLSEERQVVLHPVLKPGVTGVNVVQPENRDACVNETDSEHTPSPCCSPMRVKGKGLLERRGSNASLTLDLNRSQENVHYGTPPKECSTDEYLMSAAHRLTRKQLHNCLKDVKALHSEFWEIPMNHPERVHVAGCGTKNRYKTILPNESSRVHLKSVGDDPFASYINANYIRGYGGEKNAYIATQGPMTHTISDFWLLVWEQKCPIIVMITKLKEKLKVKCESYLPECVGHFSGIEVVVVREIPRDGYTIRELLMKKGREIHNVCHFWYTAWPDHKTPDTAKQLLSMALEVDDLRKNGNDRVKGPTVVHCSAGIGRTGCFIAISTGIKQLMEEDAVDVLGIVCGLRLDRGGMVQTAEQYEFVHQALSVFETTMTDHSGE